MANSQDTYDTHIFGGGVSYRTKNARSESPRRNAMLIFLKYAIDYASSYPISLPVKEGFYEVMAHELGHVLFDEDHNAERKNLMSEYKVRTNNISKKQCDKISANGFIK